MSENLQLFSAKIRLETCKMLAHRGFGHLGGALSIVETLSVLLGEKILVFYRLNAANGIRSMPK